MFEKQNWIKFSCEIYDCFKFKSCKFFFYKFQSFEELFLMGYIAWKMGKSLMSALRTCSPGLSSSYRPGTSCGLCAGSSSPCSWGTWGSPDWSSCHYCGRPIVQTYHWDVQPYFEEWFEVLWAVLSLVRKSLLDCLCDHLVLIIL